MNHTGNAPFSEIAQPPQRLPVAFAGVSLWSATLAQPEAVIAHWQTWLAPEERQRAERVTRPSLRYRAIAVRALLRGLLAQALEQEQAVSPASLHFQTDAHGRPSLATPFANGAIRDFNLSHSGDQLLIGILHHTAPPSWQRIGVDLESLQRSRDTARLAQRVLCARELRSLEGLDHEEHQRRFLHYWVLKEAFSKAIGAGFALGFDAMDFDIDSASPPRALALPTPHRPGDWTLQFLPVGPSFVAAMALGM
ncbi:MAG: 4'-phosphopantetheinyl transferase superfamily protein [Proteobacteria bacterium]|nr:4'-phosphopantetheinyl transferase superfamily protein [Pseudomonadota bacterium]MCL2307969.1 4'-phosphopantetheinyl transferase superfamily protein [Pseudomonadota bacterium]